MQFHVPELGERIKLTEDWTFELFDEDRNSSLIKTIDPTHIFRYYAASSMGFITLPAGSVLKVSRIYIRQGHSEFNSITFILEKNTCPTSRFNKGGRFWAKLKDANKIIGEII